jgi:hypothetical protein
MWYENYERQTKLQMVFLSVHNNANGEMQVI